MSHANAALTPRHRLIVGRLVVDEGWPISEVAARFQVSWPTAKRWADRYRAGQSMQDRFASGPVNMGQPVQVSVGQDPMDRRRRDPQATGQLNWPLSEAETELDAALRGLRVGLVRRVVGA